jgi:predicted amidohydrolase YtcJ
VYSIFFPFFRTRLSSWTNCFLNFCRPELTMHQLSAAPDLIIFNARIHTVNPAQPWAEAIAIRKHRIVAVGDSAAVCALAQPGTRQIDAGGGLVLPGMCDAHIHFHWWSLSLRELNLAQTRSRGEFLAMIAARSRQSGPTDWITGGGWNESWWGEVAFPTAAELDAVTGAEQPTLLHRSDMHSSVANSAALRLAGIGAQTPNPSGGAIDRDAQGRPTGILREMAAWMVREHLPGVSEEVRDRALLAGMATLHRLGITALHSQRVKDDNDGMLEYRSLLRLRAADRLRLRINANVAAHHLGHVAALGLRSGFGDDLLRLGHVKFFIDGSLGTRTAWMLAPFTQQAPDEPANSGLVVTSPAELAVGFRQAMELGFPVSVHAIGDRANRVVLDIFEELADAGLVTATPNRIEHVQTIDLSDLPRLGKLGITASVQPLHAPDDMDTADRYLGERGAGTYAFRSLLDSGALLALGSDAPVADPNPFLGIHSAVYRQRTERMPAPAWHAEQSISVAEAVYGYTMGAARAAGWEKAIGSLEVGKYADLVLLDRDLFAIEATGRRTTEIAETQVRMTIFGGEVVFEQ